MARLEHLGRKAEEKSMLGVAMRAEELRGKVAGYYIDKQIIKQDDISNLSLEELEKRMKTISEDYAHILEGESDEKEK